ncbi:NUDIX hydrolase domain-like protein [Cladorrhinum samala]|uniref:NUDIX hydrolase domain-like protein n=1 Tax=Cladorrhinum samala TaxID=585594 RepID=A0AAV9HT59_9PEZI|nr:NUDIX hydrolase domain-like protein [Cladorrhinum samala]
MSVLREFGPRVAVIAIIQDDEGRVCTGRRIGPLGGGTLTFPGGHVEFGEDIFTCVERETLEESGLVVKAVRVVGVTNDFFPENDRPEQLWKHYITIFAECVRVNPNQQPERMEPNKCEGWEWIKLEDIKALALSDEGTKHVFLPVINLFRENFTAEIASSVSKLP